MKKIRKILVGLAWLTIMASVVEAIGGFDIRFISWLGVAGSIVLLLDVIMNFVQGYKEGKSGFSKKSLPGKIMLVIISAFVGGGSTILLLDCLGRVRNDVSLITPISLTLFIVILFVLIVLAGVLLSKDPEFKHEMEIVKNDERLIANNHKAGYYAMNTVVVVLFGSSIIIPLFTENPSIAIFSGILAVIAGGTGILYFVLYFWFDKRG